MPSKSENTPEPGIPQINCSALACCSDWARNGNKIERKKENARSIDKAAAPAAQKQKIQLDEPSDEQRSGSGNPRNPEKGCLTMTATTAIGAEARKQWWWWWWWRW
ncbi:unnamed protein product [Microthlaspi erraticum]|uniref:Uncharacterized protein n=1 Tax=Microthlaspi erraticum TaxID=1685480 RepID=A0A6D2KGQ2_9BRAS|nr:unnamed protein product [Microthlaspi erraticum]